MAYYSAIKKNTSNNTDAAQNNYAERNQAKDYIPYHYIYIKF